MKLMNVVMPAFNGVAAGQTATCKLPIGRTYHELQIHHDASITVAEMEEIRLIANGKVIKRISGTTLDKLNQRDGFAADGGTLLTMSFDRIGMMTHAANIFTAIGTGRGIYTSGANAGKEFGGQDDQFAINELAVEIDIAAGAAGATNLKLSADQSEARPSGLIVHSSKYNVDSPAASLVTFTPALRRGVLNRIFFVSSLITHIEVVKNGFTIMGKTAVADLAINEAKAGKTAQSNYIAFDPTLWGVHGEELPLADAQQLEFRLTTSDAGTIAVQQEVLDTVIAA